MASTDIADNLKDAQELEAGRWIAIYIALLAVFLYSGFYHESFSFMAGSGYGGPFLYFLL